MSDDTMDASSVELTNTEPLTSTPLRLEQDNSVALSDGSELSLSSLNLNTSNLTLSHQSPSTSLDQISAAQEAQDCQVEQALSTPLGFKLVGDNIDKQVSPRFMRSQNLAHSLHYFHAFAIQDRVGFSHLPDICPLPLTKHGQNSWLKDVASTLLPSLEDDRILRKNFATLISRMLITHMPEMKLAFQDAVTWHIPHLYAKEMSKKSTVVRSYN